MIHEAKRHEFTLQEKWFFATKKLVANLLILVAKSFFATKILVAIAWWLKVLFATKFWSPKHSSFCNQNFSHRKSTIWSPNVCDFIIIGNQMILFATKCNIFYYQIVGRNKMLHNQNIWSQKS